MSEAPFRVLLGPQNPTRNVGRAVDESGIPDGQIAVISAGWQEAEGDIDDVRAVVARPLKDLELYRRAEAVFRTETSLAESYRARQDRLKEQQRLYRLRLRSLATAARDTLRIEGDPKLLAAEQGHAIAQLRALDRHHLHRTEALHQRFSDAYNAGTHPELERHVHEMWEIIDNSSAVLITGGNIVVLMNRLRLFGLGSLLGRSNIVAWSGGAMVLAERIVLFHEHMPQGRRDPEVFGAGLRLVPGFVFMPDAKHRLRPSDRLRIGLMARRFSPDTSVVLDNDTALYLAGDEIIRVEGARRLNRSGRLGRLRAA